MNSRFFVFFFILFYEIKMHFYIDFGFGIVYIYIIGWQSVVVVGALIISTKNAVVPMKTSGLHA